MASASVLTAASPAAPALLGPIERQRALDFYSDSSIPIFDSKISRSPYSYIEWDGNETEAERLRAIADEHYAMQIGAVIQTHYPGVLFRVSVDSPGGIARIFHELLPAAWGYTLFLRELASDPAGKCVMRACGELLERFNLPRGRYRADLWREARKQHWRTAHGIFPRVKDPVTGRERRIIPTELAR